MPTTKLQNTAEWLHDLIAGNIPGEDPLETNDDGEILITICGDYDPDTEDLAWQEVQIGHTWEGTHWSFNPRPNGILLSPEQIYGELEYAFAEHLGYESANHAAD